MNPAVQNVLVIGLGLIGGSLAKALRCKGFSQKVTGFDLNSDELAAGVRLGVIDEAAEDLIEAVASADIVVLAVPVKATDKVLRLIAPALKAGAILTDVGSTKSNVVQAARDIFGELPPGFVPGHPIAGSEKSGVAASDENLFVRHKIILTPLPESAESAVLTVARMWLATGAEVLQMPLERHDQILAATSHLPHVLAFSLVDTLAREEDSTEIFRYAAGGFRDFTRIAASDPTMWHDICIANREALLAQIDQFSAGVDKLREAIDQGDSQSLLGIFTRAKASREHFGRILSRSAYSHNLNKTNVTFHAQPGGSVSGEISVPGDKSISHRAVMLAALANGITEIKGFLQSEDSLATLQAFRDMGVVIEGPHLGVVKVYGVGLYGLQPAPGPIYLGNSGTSMRLLSGVLAAQPFSSQLQGDQALSRRPMARVVDPLRTMGADISCNHSGLPPVSISGGSSLNGINYQLPIASAQVKSALLLAGLYSQEPVTVSEPAVTRDHTERMLEHFGVELVKANGEISLPNGQQLSARDIEVPGDFSSAAFFIVAATIASSGELLLKNVGINETRTGLLDILQLMGADIELLNLRDCGAEPVADLRVRPSRLKGIDVPEELVSRAIDEFPILMVAAACANGVTRFSGAAELRVKESDRLEAMVTGLKAVGIDANATVDGAEIRGGRLQGGEVNSFGDHRIAMSFAIAALAAENEIMISDCANVATSFPEFTEVAGQAGITIHKEED